MNQHLSFPPTITLPGPSPIEEVVRWQGAPSWRAAAFRIWHIRAAAFYFAVLLAEGLRDSLATTAAGALARQGEVALGVIAVGSTALLCILAWLTARTTAYTVTDTHLMMKYGIALKATLVIPFGAIEHVAIRVNSDHTGDLSLRLKPGRQILYPKLWPHVRPWTWLRAEPMLRCVPKAAIAGALLARGMAASAEMRRLLVQERAALGLAQPPSGSAPSPPPAAV